MKIFKRKNIAKTNRKPRMWLAIVVAFFVGCVIGYSAHYLIVNWHGFFAVCDDGNRPDKNGCCAGEVYTDAGDGWMVCCPNGSDNCFPPLK